MAVSSCLSLGHSEKAEKVPGGEQEGLGDSQGPRDVQTDNIALVLLKVIFYFGPYYIVSFFFFSRVLKQIQVAPCFS